MSPMIAFLSSAVKTAQFSVTEICDALFEIIAFIVGFFGRRVAWRITIDIDLATPILKTRRLMNAVGTHADLESLEVIDLTHPGHLHHTPTPRGVKTHTRTVWIAPKCDSFDIYSPIGQLQLARALQRDLGKNTARDYGIPDKIDGRQSVKITMRPILVRI